MTASLAGLSACGPGAAAEAIRPKDQTAASALEEGGGTCHEVESTGEPLIVDWKPELRGDLEVAMHDGVAIVAYSCKGIKLLKDCKLEGQYGFIGTTKKESMVRLTNADEVAANLPLSGVKLGGEVGRGSTIDIAMVMVGKKRTTWDGPTKQDLKGSCDGATHYVRGATVGAFALETGTEAKVRAVAEMFGASASAASTSAKQTKNREGDISDCGKASPDSTTPPSQCGAPIRLALAAILQAPPKEAEAPKAVAPISVQEDACPKGLVLAEGKCTTPASAPSFQCEPGDVATCTAQCDKGHAGSCGTLGAMYAEGRPVSRDNAKAATLLKKACDGGNDPSCTNLGILTIDGAGVTADPAAAVKLFERGCQAGDGRGCRWLATAYQKGKGVSEDPAKALSLFKQACEGGDDFGCGSAGRMLLDGKGAAADPKKAADMLKRACDGTDAESCGALASMYEDGSGIGKNQIIAWMLFMRGCNRLDSNACFGQARVELAKPNGNEGEAKRLLERACAFRSDGACATLKVAFGGSRPVFANPADADRLRKGCNMGSARDCAMVGLYAVAMGNKPMGIMDLDRACQRGDGFACFVAKKAK